MNFDPYALATASLRRLDPETAHRLTLRALQLGLGPKASSSSPRLATHLAGLRLTNPIGLAAGFDKNAEVPDAMLAAGFGFVECGTVTPRPQAGNPRPRLFRLTEDQAVINRMGFNNDGLESFITRLTHRKGRSHGPVGANIGANKDSQDRIGDYVLGFARLFAACDYFTVNISSPNTPGLRDLQSHQALQDLTGRLAETRRELVAATVLNPPVLLKVAPDLAKDDIGDMVETVVAAGFDGIIVSNTTVSRPVDLQSLHRQESGGLSGKPLFALSTEILRQFHLAARGRLVLVGAGGVSTGAEAYAKIRAGAQAIQLYSALVYAGPGLVSAIGRDLSARIAADGFSTVAEAIGQG